MKNILYILLFWVGSVNAQSVPNTTTFNLHNAQTVIGYNNLGDCFTYSDAAKFDATYGSKTMSPKTLYGFRNYGASCTRPEGLGSYYYFIYVINGVTITADNACYYATNHSGDGLWLYGQTFALEGSDVYFCSDHTCPSTDCTKLSDGYYILTRGTSWTAVRVYGGKLYYIPC